jgi:hypothetical protein
MKKDICPICKRKDSEATSQLFLIAIQAIQKDNRQEQYSLRSRIAELEKKLEGK